MVRYPPYMSQTSTQVVESSFKQPSTLHVSSKSWAIRVPSLAVRPVFFMGMNVSQMYVSSFLSRKVKPMYHLRMSISSSRLLKTRRWSSSYWSTRVLSIFTLYGPRHLGRLTRYYGTDIVKLSDEGSSLGKPKLISSWLARWCYPPYHCNPSSSRGHSPSSP